MQRTYAEINEKIKSGRISALTALEAKNYIKENGLKKFISEVDLVTFASFEINTNALLYLSFGQTDPLIYFNSALVNDVSACVTGATDLAVSCISTSSTNQNYSGAKVIEDLVKGKDLYLYANGKGTEVFQNKQFDTWFNLSDVNHARLILNQAINQNCIVATNSGDSDIDSPYGTLIGKLENSTYNSSSFINPLINDPFLKTIGVGSQVWIAGTRGIITGQGSNHNPLQKKNDKGIPIGSGATLSMVADLNGMNPKWIRGGNLKSYGPVLYIGIGIPVPVLNEEIAECIRVSDADVFTSIVDFSIPRRTKPVFGMCSYEELRTSTVTINGKPTLSAPLVSMAYSVEITKNLKQDICNKSFYISEPIASINMNHQPLKLNSRLQK